ncbi:MAG: di-trans,poly-cis-decaprenylcistransferase [Bacteroidetes bacterium RIFCSPHIGHO2_02_FULL_44_7]|nr:MAG: di-trans,poly-cis-decaprenylcistransferase [Bacteroidetes bacterium RIFCSPHIGHO2_02_FULL_44_7]
MSALDKIDLNKTPEHVAIIMDGNGRWAQQQGQDRLFRHNFGVESVRESLRAAEKVNVKYLTLYAFSTENWNRPKVEVDGLMDLLVRTLAKEVDDLHENNVVIRSIGYMEGLPESCREELKMAYEKTANNTGVHLILALNYSARWELKDAMHKLACKVKSGELSPEAIDENLIQNELTTYNIPDPELLIRTSGERRVSNFLLWQIAYAEFYFTDVLWPDFKEEDLFEAILDYQARERRFGMVSAQIEKNA